MSEAARVSLPLIVLAWTVIFAAVLFAIAHQNLRLRRELVGKAREPREALFELAWATITAALVVLVVLLGDRAAGGGVEAESDAAAPAYDAAMAATATLATDTEPAPGAAEPAALSR
ncbi:hypothetical protein [Piscinibacter koreensis]|uniref:Uncharacterized protein n=1 Tax=Piscinibacter koreensis TaxID=2742824 RepID=A0A7Y6TX04_9BURK|nr:hypothetical protein [Schlegelella koreensis]NUZ06605.1 hypothetical protein [Schlegelella koreensis]